MLNILSGDNRDGCSRPRTTVGERHGGASAQDGEVWPQTTLGSRTRGRVACRQHERGRGWRRGGSKRGGQRLGRGPRRERGQQGADGGTL